MLRLGFQFFASVLLVPLTTVIQANEAAISEHNRDWYFEAFLDEKPIGYHRFSLSANGEQKILNSQAQFEVKFLFIRAYVYEHNASERWSGNCLQTISSQTNDNGERYAVNGVAREQEFELTTQQGREQLPPCVMSFAYWNPSFLQRDRLLNPQTGEFVAVEVSALGQEQFRAGSETVLAERYRLVTQGQTITVWYSAEDHHWLGLESLIEDKYRLRYELRDFAMQTVLNRIAAY